MQLSEPPAPVLPDAHVETTYIRPLKREDRPQIHLLLDETGVFTEEEISIALELVDAVLDKPGQRDYIINSCISEGTVAGYYCIGPTPATESTFDLYWIAVKPSAQGKGIGGMLNAHAETVVQSLQGRLLVAETSSQPKYQNTRKFYINHGYSELARIANYYRIGDDLVVYGKYLS